MDGGDDYKDNIRNTLPHGLNKSEASIKLQVVEEGSRSRTKEGNSFDPYSG